GGGGQAGDEVGQRDAADLGGPHLLLERLHDRHGVLGGDAGALQRLDAGAAAVGVGVVATHDLEVAGGEAGHQAANGSSPSRPSSTSKRFLTTLPVKPQMSLSRQR